jgi:hypothetical protein
MRRNPIWSFLIAVLTIVVLWFILGGIWQLLKWGAPALAIGALVINFGSVRKHILWQLALLKANPLSGIVVLVLSVLLYPITATYLFFRALLSRSTRNLKQNLEKEKSNNQEEIYTEYEEIIEPPMPRRQEPSHTEDWRNKGDRFV